VRPLYAAADCFMLPTRYDPFPNAVLEAMAMGLPAIVGRRCGAAEIVRPGENGWICEPDDAIGLARLMGEADRELRGEQLSAAARATAERLSLEVMVKQLIELYASLAERAP
jgi:UDP-glucose:(heptosyl)LPS alpha-1,3-glucosyltransferase